MTTSRRRWLRMQWKTHKMLWNSTGGRVGRTIGGIPVVELVSTGHKTGKRRQILIYYFEDEGMPAIIGTNGGKDEDPAWAKNLRANPEAQARWAGKWRDVVARELQGEDYDRVWDRAVERQPQYEEYGGRLTRTVPIYRLEPVR